MVERKKSSLQLTLSLKDQTILESWQRSTNTPIGLVKRGQIILFLAQGETVLETSNKVRMARQHIYKWARRFMALGIRGLYRVPNIKIRKAENKTIQSALFTILHSPPSEYNINRVTWRIGDLKICLKRKGINVSEHVIRKIIISAGYKWRKAKAVLTSTDPKYREKLNHIQSILTNLRNNDCFFSIDEYGPFAIKIYSGRKLVAPNDYPSVPQYQKSKGSLIITAALELTTNQVIHFYSKNKNTEEMIKLLDLLLVKYNKCDKLYLSWDAASWHASKQLYKKVKGLNDENYRKKYNTPFVHLVPLPQSAQFLNVIESVFSGMAKAIIHNSDYKSVNEAKNAIDRYFRERNEYFKAHPKKAGNKIWGKELVAAKFVENQNCKDPRYR